MRTWGRFLMFGVLGAVVLGMAGCGGSGGPADAGQEGGASGGGSQELTVAIWDTYQEPGLKEIMAGFTEETGIGVKIQVTPWDQYWTMMEAGATGGTLPDVFWMHSNQIAKYAEYDLLLDLSDQIAASQVAIPKDMDTVALWYNKTAFDDAGLAYPDETWTWDTFREAAKTLTKADGSQYGTVLSPKANQETYYNLIYDWGGTVISEDRTKSGWDDPKTIEAMEYIEALIADGSMPPYTTIAENEPLALFESGKVAMCMFGSWQSDLLNNEYVKEHCDLAVLPSKDGKRVSIYNGLGWSAAAEGSNTENAWKLLEYLSSEEAQKQQADLGVTMSACEGTSDGFVNKSEIFNLQAYLDMMEDVVIRPYSMDTVVWENMSIETLVNAWNGTSSMADTCRQIAESMNASLAQEQK